MNENELEFFLDRDGVKVVFRFILHLIIHSEYNIGTLYSLFHCRFLSIKFFFSLKYIWIPQVFDMENILNVKKTKQKNILKMKKWNSFKWHHHISEEFFAYTELFFCFYYIDIRSKV